ncbi:MAG: hypothetical protein ACXU8Z_10760 [Caulobacteraceae bacterium]
MMSAWGGKQTFDDARLPDHRHHAMRHAILALSIYALGATAVLAKDSPEAFLSQILAHDFHGDGAFRVGMVRWTQEAGTVGDCGCSTPREAFLATLSPIEIVSDWKLVGPASSKPTDTAFIVRYRLIGLTKGEGDWSNGPNQRRIVPLGKPRDEEVTYRVKWVKGHWKLVDPPLPRVGVKSLVLLVQQDTDRLAKTISNLPPDYPKDGGARRALAWEQDQLSQLQAAFGS